MAETTPPEETPAQTSFRAHVQAFHQGLPAEEQTLLEQVFALAAGAADQSDTQGFAGPIGNSVAIVLIELDKWRYGGSGQSPLGQPGGGS